MAVSGHWRAWRLAFGLGLAVTTLVSFALPLDLAQAQTSQMAGRFVQTADRQLVYLTERMRYNVTVWPISASDLGETPTGFPIYSRSDICELSPAGDPSVIQRLAVWHGRFVNPHDETIWFVYGGHRFRVTTLEADETALAPFEPNGVIANRDDLCAVLAVRSAVDSIGPAGRARPKSGGRLGGDLIGGSGPSKPAFRAIDG